MAGRTGSRRAEGNRLNRSRLAPAAVAALAGGVGIFGFAVAVAGQPAGQPVVSAPSAMDPDEITGRDFSGIRLTATPQLGDLVLKSQRLWQWSEATSADIAGDTHRLYLQGDVRVEFGVYRFSAVQASVWIERIGTSTGGKGIHEVAIFFDRVSDPGAQAGFAQAGDRLLVTGVLEGEVRLAPDVIRQGQPREAFVGESEQRLARLLRDLVTGGPGDAGGVESAGPESTAPIVSGSGPVIPGMSRPYEPGSPLGPDRLDVRQQDYQLLPPAERRPAIFAKKAIITFAWSPDDEPRLMPAKPGEERAAIMAGGIVMVYNDRASGNMLQVSAERAVVFFEEGPAIDLVQAPAEKIRGVYLEGDVVATDGRYTLRGPKVYYDVQNNKAVMLDAVFFTFDEQRQLPMYLRAAAIRQEARGQFSAQKATMASSSFFQPHLSIGATSITVTQARAPARPTITQLLEGTDPGERDATLVDARGVSLRAGRTPFFWWPKMKGDPTAFPLRSLRMESSDNSGFAIKTAWDVFSLVGVEKPDELSWRILADGYFERGPALGTEMDWGNEDSRGGLYGYLLFNDDGEDHLSSGGRVEQDGDTRGLIYGEHVWDIDDQWMLFIEGAYFSDETFVDAFQRDLGQNSREFRNNVFLQGTDANAVLSLEAGIEANDFTVNQYLLQSPGYSTIKQPELRYSRVNDDLLSGDFPGLLSWSQDWRLSRMYLNFTEPTARELGFDNIERAREAFGLLPDQSLADRLRAEGYTESAVMRADTRHEFSSRFELGPVNLIPFVVARGTVYDRDFEDYSADADDSYRLFGAAGMRASTTIQHVDNSVDSKLFDLHRVRHIIEPNVTAWSSASTVDQNDLPVYDEHVESLADGSAVKFGVMQTWQTQRGGLGRTRSVDFLKLNVEYVESSSDADRESPISRFFDAFPEYSLLGDFATADLVWQVSDAFALSFNEIYDFEINQSARTSVGGVVKHSEEFSSYAEARYINARDITLVDFGVEYKFTSRYSLSSSVTLDTDEGDVQTVQGTLRRRFPTNTLGVTVRYNNIDGDTSVGVVFEPQGMVESRSAALRRRLRAEDLTLIEGTPAPSALE
jgi:hypothetical protein